MRVQTEEWRKFIPGVRMYKGKKTLFYNGEILWEKNWWDGGPLIYNKEERNSWEVIIVLPGVEAIEGYSFFECANVKTVIMNDTVRRVGYEEYTFGYCKSLVYVKFSRNLYYLGTSAFFECTSLTSIFIPQTCRVMGESIFRGCKKLIIFVVPRYTWLRVNVIRDTELFKLCPVEYDNEVDDSIYNRQINDWIQNRHADDQFALHRACSSDNPLLEEIYEIVKQQGLAALKKPDSIGITASKYLAENPFTEIKEQEIIKRYINDMIGETV